MKRVTLMIAALFLISTFFSVSVFAQDNPKSIRDYSQLSKEELAKIDKQNIEKYNKLNKRKKATVTYENAISQIDFSFKDTILKEILKYEEENPTASEDEVNAQFMKLAEKYNKNNPELADDKITTMANPITSPFYNIVEGMANLFPEEEALMDENPSKGFKAIVAGDEAMSYTAYKFGYNGHNDHVDAFRHSAWNIWIIGFTNDYDWAYRWTLAHEIGGDLYANQPAHERVMDDTNNAVGRAWAEDAGISTSSSVDLTRSVINWSYFSGQLKKIVNGNYVQNFTGSPADFVN